MEMHQVRYFVAVSRTPNFTRGADECNVTQPSLTRAIKQLDAELGYANMVTHETELKTLMLASQRGDAAAYRTLLTKLAPRLRAYYKRRMMGAGRGAEEAEDLVQETLLAVHVKRHTYDPDALFTPWLHAIARYKLIDHFRRNKMSRIDVPIDAHQELMAAEDRASTEGTHDMTKLLSRLPQRARQAIESVKLEDKGVAETAACHGMSESNVKISIHRDLKTLASFILRFRFLHRW